MSGLKLDTFWSRYQLALQLGQSGNKWLPKADIMIQVPINNKFKFVYIYISLLRLPKLYWKLKFKLVM